MNPVMQPSSDVRQEILDAAEGLFARYGFKKTSVDDVAGAARIGKGSVYLHFDSKEDLFAEVVRRASDRMLTALLGAVSRARTPVAKLRAFVQVQMTTVAEIMAQYSLAEETLLELLPLAASVRRGYLAREHDLLVEVLRDGAAAGAFVVDHPELLAAGLMAGMTAVQAHTAVDDRKDPQVIAGLDEVASVLIRALTSGSRRSPEPRESPGRLPRGRKACPSMTRTPKGSAWPHRGGRGPSSNGRNPGLATLRAGGLCEGHVRTPCLRAMRQGGPCS